MIINDLDERMITIRGKGLLYGFMCMSLLLVLKNAAIDLLGFHIESVTKTDFAIIYVSMFLVAIYMLIHDGVSESWIARSRFIFLVLSILFTGLVVIELMDPSAVIPFPSITNSFNLIAEAGFTLTCTILIFRKYRKIKEIS